MDLDLRSEAQGAEQRSERRECAEGAAEALVKRQEEDAHRRPRIDG
jgi:hypothetical protein